MKTIGITNDGNVLVEMTNDEHNQFILLSNAVEGNTMSFLERRNYVNTEFQKTFEAIRTWIELKLNVNEIREMAKYLDEVIGNKKL